MGARTLFEQRGSNVATQHHRRLVGDPRCSQRRLQQHLQRATVLAHRLVLSPRSAPPHPHILVIVIVLSWSPDDSPGFTATVSCGVLLFLRGPLPCSQTTRCSGYVWWLHTPFTLLAATGHEDI